MNEKTNEKIKDINQKSLLDFCYKRNNEISLEDIIIKKELRRPLKQFRVEELIKSIQERGLINPILITEENVLIAGYHRVEAFRQMGKTKIPCTIVNIKDPLELKLMEIDDNRNRSKLSTPEMYEDFLSLRKIYRENKGER